MRRDSQRAKVYASDRVLYDWCQAHAQLVLFKDLDEVKAFVARVHKWAKRQPLRPFHVRETPPNVKLNKSYSTSYAHGGKWVIAFNDKHRDYHWSNVIVIHELAHLYNTEWGHGRNYCRKYLALVKRFISREAGAALRAAFVKRAVQHRKKAVGRKRRLTVEQREIQIRRLAAYRFTKKVEPDAV